MSRRRNAHKLIDQAAEQATTLVETAAEQASALVDQVAPHVEAARERVVSDYVPQARKAGRRARKQLMEEYVPQAKAALGREPEPKRRGRTVLKLAVLAGVGTAVGQWLRNRNVSPAAMYEAPVPQPSEPVDLDPVPPGAVGEHNPDPEDLARLEDEAPPPPDDSLNAFFDEIAGEPAKGSRRR